MSQTMKSAAWVLIAVVVIGGLWWVVSRPTAIAPVAEDQTMLPADSTSAALTSENTADEALDADLSTIDVQLDALNADVSNVDSGLNDSPIPQGE